MELSFEQLDGGITLAKLSGRLDLAGARSIDLPFTAHVATKSVRVVVDLSQVSFLAVLLDDSFTMLFSLLPSSSIYFSISIFINSLTMLFIILI